MTEEELDEAYRVYLRTHPAYDEALVRVLSWINAQEYKHIAKGELYEAIQEMRDDGRAYQFGDGLSVSAHSGTDARRRR